MQIDFFEEFPSEESLSRARLWNQPCLVYLAARDLEEYDRYAALLKRIQPLAKPGFWPILPSTYWVSPFSPASELLELKQRLTERPGLDVLVDLELPVLSGRRSQFFRGLPGFFQGRQIIRAILQLPHRFLLAVYPAPGAFSQKLMYALGIDQRGIESCVMYYSSMMPGWLLGRVQGALKRRAAEGQRTAGLGCLAPGIFGTEPVLTPEALRRDLEFAREIGLKRIVLFRLGGLSAPFALVLKESRTKTRSI